MNPRFTLKLVTLSICAGVLCSCAMEGEGSNIIKKLIPMMDSKKEIKIKVDVPSKKYEGDDNVLGFVLEPFRVEFENLDELHNARLTIYGENLDTNLKDITGLVVTAWKVSIHEIDQKVRFSNKQPTILSGRAIKSTSPLSTGYVSMEFQYDPEYALVFNISTSVERRSFQIYPKASKINTLFVSPYEDEIQVLNAWELQSKAWHRIFVTSELYNGNLGGISGADLNCAKLAMARNINARVSALVADQNSVPWERISIRGPVFNTKLQRVAHTAKEFWAGDFLNSFLYTENGDPIRGSSVKAWTGLSSDMRVGEHCNNWSSTSRNEISYYGEGTKKDPRWLSQSKTSCHQTLRLFCITH